MDFLDVKFSGLKKNNYREGLVAIDNFSKLRWTVPLKERNVQRKKVLLKTSKFLQRENQNYLRLMMGKEY